VPARFFIEAANPFMCRNSYRSYRLSLWNPLPLASLLIAFFCTNAFAQNLTSAYTVTSSTPNEVVISIHPQYSTRTVTDEKTGESYERISVIGGTTKGLVTGTPAAEWIPVELLAPSKEEATVTILKEEYEPAHNAILAPLPQWTYSHDEWKTPLAHYIKKGASYSSYVGNIVSLGLPAIYRTAYTRELHIDPIQFDASTNTIRLIKEMLVKITFPNATFNTNYTAGKQEAELFGRLFANGNISEYYHSAVDEVTKGITANTISFKKNSAPLSPGEAWLLVTTNDQGVYHITASDLTKAGITNPNPKAIQLFGYGGATIPEDPDSVSGELHECPIDVLTNGDGSLNEIRFYDPGLYEWYFNPEGGETPIYSLYHLLNPFTTSGHYLLKTGGSQAKNIPTLPANIVSPILQSTVPVVVVHEDEERFEDPGISREFIGEEIPNGRDVTISLPDLPGYTSDSTVFRPGFNMHAQSQVTFNLTVNGMGLNPILNNYTIDFSGEEYTVRNWETEILAGNALRSQNNSVVLSATSDELDGKYWLDFAEIFYRRQTNLTSGQVPFYVLADGRALSYNFTDAANGEAWEVSDPWSPVKIAIATGSSMNVQIQGDANGFKQFIAFNSSSLKSPSLIAAGALTLHTGICQTGAEDIIVTPKEYLDAANKLAAQRQMGGQATPPMTVAVVTTDDIYKEFGYGSPDYSAIRDFMAYTFRHTTANNTTKPLFLTLFANGHTDYRNKTTQIPVGVPIYELWKDGAVAKLSPRILRTTQPLYGPDDPFFVRLTPNSITMDAAVGRVTVHSDDEANAFVSKVIKYETSSDSSDWRTRISFICDDRYYENLLGPDPIYHIDDTKAEIAEVPERILVNDIFGQAYPNTFTAVGRRKPEMEKAIVDAFNNGSAILSWVGHGNPVVWANEAVLTVPATINKLTNFNRLAFVTTATCDFSRFDNYQSPVSGGVLLITKPDGGAIASLGTCRSVFGEEPLVPEFYRVLLQTGCNDRVGTAPIGIAYISGRLVSTAANRLDNAQKFYIMGDPSQRILIPNEYVTIDSIDGIPFSGQNPRTIAALSQVTITGHISHLCDGSDIDGSFNGTSNLTLFDAPTHISVTTTFLESSPITDTWDIDGPILYRGSSTVRGGIFHTTFVVPKDIKFDTNNAKISIYASSDNFHTALGVTRNVVIFGIDTSLARSQGPQLFPYIGSRAFKSGDIVPVNSQIIVDVSAPNGLNSSTSSIGHSFIGWTDDSTAATIDLASTYISKQDDFRFGTSQQQAVLPAGTHTLHVRAFDALDNPAFAEIQFTARTDQPYSLYNTQITPNPVTNDRATFTFLQPASPESPVDVTITIFTIIGQQVRTISVMSISQNSISIPFDGKDDSGTLLTDGTYIYRITARERLSGTETVSGGKFLIVRGQ
jgi:hypothetical protein